MPIFAILLILMTKILKQIIKNELGALIFFSVIASTILVHLFFRTI